MANYNNRTVNSIRNVIVSVGCQIAFLILSFVTRTLFIQILGNEYLGINGLFSNILTVLSLADLGFGTAIVYSLYKPLVDNDEEKIAATVNFYGKVYRVVAVVVLTVGLALIPFLKYLVNLEADIPYLYLYYVLFLLDSVCSYLFVYKSSVLEADQKNYIVKLNRTIFLLLAHVLKLVVLYFTHNYIFYLCMQVICTLAANVSIYIIAEKQYPFIKNNKHQLPKTEKTSIMDDVKSLFMYKVGGVILNSTDNILISVLVSTAVVGLYSNYYLLFGTIVTFSEIIFGALNASVGNLGASKGKEELHRSFSMINFANFWIYGFCSIMLFCLLDDFIYLWLGEAYVLGTTTSLIIAINVFMPGMLSAVSCFRNATGLFKQTKYVFCITAGLNLVLSVILGKIWGLNGILAATAISRLLTNVWYEPYVLVKKYLGKSYLHYVGRTSFYYLMTGVLMATFYAVKAIFYKPGWISFGVEVVIFTLLVNLVFILVFHCTDAYQDILKRVIPLLKHKFKRRKTL